MYQAGQRIEVPKGHCAREADEKAFTTTQRVVVGLRLAIGVGGEAGKVESLNDVVEEPEAAPLDILEASCRYYGDHARVIVLSHSVTDTVLDVTVDGKPIVLDEGESLDNRHHGCDGSVGGYEEIVNGRLVRALVRGTRSADADVEENRGHKSPEGEADAVRRLLPSLVRWGTALSIE